jgi:hypothetical protein
LTEGELTARFAALTEPGDDASWDDVRARARALGRRRLRAPLAFAAVFVLAVVVAAPALGRLPGRIEQLFASSEPAPQRVDKSFAELSGGTAAGAVKVLATPVAPNLDAVLWVAPTRDGGYCTKVDLVGRGGAGAECVAVQPGKRLYAEVSLHGTWTGSGRILSGPVLLDGETSNPKADSLLLRFEDGDSVRIPLVWVTAPVETGFFLYGIPERHWRAGHLPTTLTLYAADGGQLDRRDVTGIPTG